LCNAVASSAAKVVVATAPAFGTGAHTELCERNAATCVELVETLLAARNRRLLVGLARDEGLDWAGAVLSKWDTVRTLESVDTVTRARIDRALASCEHATAASTHARAWSAAADGGRGGGAAGAALLHTLAALEYDSVPGRPTEQAAAWEVALSSGGATLGDALMALWCVSLESAHTCEGREAIARSACFALVRAPAIVAAVAARGVHDWYAAEGAQVLAMVSSRRTLVAAASAAWGVDVVAELRASLARHGLGSDAANEASGQGKEPTRSSSAIASVVGGGGIGLPSQAVVSSRLPLLSREAADDTLSNAFGYGGTSAVSSLGRICFCSPFLNGVDVQWITSRARIWSPVFLFCFEAS
jgi:hypothetical protein